MPAPVLLISDEIQRANAAFEAAFARHDSAALAGLVPDLFDAAARSIAEPAEPVARIVHEVAGTAALRVSRSAELLAGVIDEVAEAIAALIRRIAGAPDRSALVRA